MTNITSKLVRLSIAVLDVAYSQSRRNSFRSDPFKFKQTSLFPTFLTNNISIWIIGIYKCEKMQIG